MKPNGMQVNKYSRLYKNKLQKYSSWYSCTILNQNKLSTQSEPISRWKYTRFKRDTCWKAKLEKTRSSKPMSWKVWSQKVSVKLESTNRSWKVLNAVLSNQKFSNSGSNFSTSFFPISFRSFQLLVFSNYPFQLHVSRKYTRFKTLNTCHKNNHSSHR